MSEPTAQEYQNAILAWGDASPILHRLLTHAAGLIERAETAERQIAAVQEQLTFWLTTQDLDLNGYDDTGICPSCDAESHDEHGFCPEREIVHALALLDAQPSKKD